MIGTMTPDEIEATLRRGRTGRLGCSVVDHPYVVPINYAYADGFVYAYSALGRKIGVMRQQPRVCFEVDEIDGPSSWRCVIAEGRYEELADEEARRAALTRLVRGADGLVHRVPDADRGTVVFRLRLSAKSGRFERRDA